MALGVLNGMMNAGGRYAEDLYLTAKVKASDGNLLKLETMKLQMIFSISQDLLFGGVKTGVVALLAEMLDRFGGVIPNLDDVVPLPLALQECNTMRVIPKMRIYGFQQQIT